MSLADPRHRDCTIPATDETSTPPPRPSYIPVHLYTILQIVTTVIIFIVTLTRGAPAFPVIIVALVPFRLLVMKRWWPREYLRFVDAWACREGTPEDDEDAAAKQGEMSGSNDGHGNNQEDGLSGGVFAPHGEEHQPKTSPESGNNGAGHDWIELDFRTRADEELGRSIDA